MSDLGVASGIFAVLGGLFFFFLAIAVAVYIVAAIGCRKVLKYFGHQNTWMAFIPCLNVIALAQCVKADEEDNVAVFGQKIKKNYFVLFPVLQLIVSFIPTIGGILSFAIGIIGCGITYKDLLSRSNNQGDTTVLAWVSAVIGIVWLVMCYINFNGIEPVVEVAEPEAESVAEEAPAEI